MRKATIGMADAIDLSVCMIRSAERMAKEPAKMSHPLQEVLTLFCVYEKRFAALGF